MNKKMRLILEYAYQVANGKAWTYAPNDDECMRRELGIETVFEITGGLFNSEEQIRKEAFEELLKYVETSGGGNLGRKENEKKTDLSRNTKDMLGFLAIQIKKQKLVSQEKFAEQFGIEARQLRKYKQELTSDSRKLKILEDRFLNENGQFKRSFLENFLRSAEVKKVDNHMELKTFILTWQNHSIALDKLKKQD
ncbi:hypothetical protein [Shewanella fodinae]|uniref:Uncharacterized protein n=1 Tax=Shewanella fodinae TaxID=552357 RepID=A0A4R2FGN3_9GAMM|nr:hypothetical protein [Shewanella fodinae]TCN87871.1 hypothetical protein EDC91_1042 [Shewanella fodinae]